VFPTRISFRPSLKAELAPRAARVLDKTETRKRKWSGSHFWRVGPCQPLSLFPLPLWEVVICKYESARTLKFTKKVSSRAAAGGGEGFGGPHSPKIPAAPLPFSGLFYPGLYARLLPLSRDCSISNRLSGCRLLEFKVFFLLSWCFQREILCGKFRSL